MGKNKTYLLLFLVPLNFFIEHANTNEEMWALNNLNHVLVIAENVNFLERERKKLFSGASKVRGITLTVARD
jgi:hypothetical protein